MERAAPGDGETGETTSGAPAGRRGVAHEFSELLRKQWLLAGILALTLFIDIEQATDAGRAGLLLLLCAASASACAVFATRHPVRSALVLAATLAASSLPLLALGGPPPRLAYFAFGGFPLAGVAAGLTVAAMLVRFARPVQAAGSIALLSAVVAAGTVLNVGPRTTNGVGGLAVTASLMLGMAVAFGLFLRARDSERTQAVEAAVAEAQTAERMALARELHDIVAHHVTGIVVQAQAARMVAANDPHVAVDALDQIEHAGADALVAMRRLVRSMRGDAANATASAEAEPGGVDEPRPGPTSGAAGETGYAAGSPAGSPGGSSAGHTAGYAAEEQATTDLAADVHRLVERSRHGVSTDLDLDVPPRLPPEMARSALRIVQEALTNIGKHAVGATRVQVTVRGDDDALSVRVGDDGDGGDDGNSGSATRVGGGGYESGGRGRPRPSSSDGDGYGLVGMRERVDLLRGRLIAGPGPHGGWIVDARLPIAGDADDTGETTP